jgi:hypothetical protein
LRFGFKSKNKQTNKNKKFIKKILKKNTHTHTHTQNTKQKGGKQQQQQVVIAVGSASKQAKCMMTDVHTYIPARSNERHEEHQEGCSNGHPNYELDSTKQQALQNSTFNYIYYNSSAAAQQQQ